MTRLEWVRLYAEHGWPVFPLYEMQKDACSCGNSKCGSPGKHPRISVGLYGASINGEEITRWWTEWPNANIGLRTGEASGLLVLDVDVDKGGEESFTELEAEFGRIPDTPESHTGGGGQHHVFKHPGGEIGNRAHFRPGLDIRGNGGYIVVPPSNHRSGKDYDWDAVLDPFETALANVPQWLLDVLVESHPDEPLNYDRKPWDGEIPLRAANVLEAWSSIQARFDRVSSGLKDTSGSGIDYSLACLLTRRGLTGAETEETIRASRKKAELKEKGDAYYTLTVGKALKYASADRLRHGHTDLGNMERLVDQFGPDIRYVHAWKTWLLWDGQRWARDNTGGIYRFAKETIRRIFKEAETEKNEECRKAMLKHATRSQSERAIRALVELAKSDPMIAIDAERLDHDHWLLNCQNGTIDLSTGKLQAHQMDNLITRLTPVDYDPDAKLGLFNDFLETVLPEEELSPFVQRALGMSATGDTREEVLFFAYGPTASGKSTLLEAVKSALGDYAATADFETFLARKDVGGPRGDIARLAGTRFVASIEVDQGKRLAEGLIKNLTGGDTVTTRHMYEREFEFRPQFTLWLAANDRPKIHDDDAAIWRRIHQVPFRVCIPEKDRDPAVKAKLRDVSISGKAVLAWLVEGCLEWQRIGLQVPDCVQRATREYRAEMDPIADFLAECCVEEPTTRVKAADLWGSYLNWCKDNRIRGISQKLLGKRLKDKGFVKERTRSSRWWFGIGLIDQAGRVTHGDACDPTGKKPPYDRSLGGFTENGSDASHASPGESEPREPERWWDS